MQARHYSFNPRTRKGCDNYYSKYRVESQVSIHAPVKDATVCLQCTKKRGYVSIHAPVKDATTVPTQAFVDAGFNPRTRKGCDTYENIIVQPRFVSIHAPVKDATRFPPVTTCDYHSFNPRTRKGCDFGKQDDVIHFNCFNPRTRKGCDVRSSCGLGVVMGFNPRTRKGCDFQICSFGASHRSFNPRTRKGCDDKLIGAIEVLIKFQSTHP